MNRLFIYFLLVVKPEIAEDFIKIHSYFSCLTRNCLVLNKMKIEDYFKKSPVFQLILCGRKVESFVNDGLEKMGLSYFQALILVTIHVENRDDILMRELVQLFPLSKGAISQIISALEGHQLVLRKNSQDRRSSFIRITPQGIDFAFKVRALLEECEQHFDPLIEVALFEKMKASELLS